MYKIMGPCGCGKTTSLLLTAATQNGVVVCKNPQHTKLKAAELGVLRNIELYSYDDFIQGISTNKSVFIDEIEHFLLYLEPHMSGYSLTIDA